MRKAKQTLFQKLQIALKETHETYYWLEVLKGAELLSEDGFSRLSVPCNELRVMLIASINTAKERAKDNGES